jgi:uncharacterized protein (TIGR02246 family)
MLSIPLLLLGLAPLAVSTQAASATKRVSKTGFASRAEGERALREMEAGLAAAVASKDGKAFLAFWADDTATFPPGKAAVVGKENILKEWAPILENPDVSLSWEPDKVEVSGSGDLGYTYGKYRWIGKDPAGQPAVRNGKYVTIWRKEKDGKWRVVVDLGTPSDPPSPHPAP